MSSPLLVAYSVSGGSPPPTLESLRVHEDGSARAIVTSAWPRGEPLDEAGLYETRLDAPLVERLRALAGRLAPAVGEHGPIRADSGRASIALGEDGGRIVWGASAPPPPPVDEAVAELRDVLAEVRRHPIAAARLALSAADGGLELELTNPGTEALGVSLVRPRVAQFAGEGAPPLSLYRSATEVAALPDGTLGGGERRRVAIETPAGDALAAFATLTLELPVEPEPVALEGFLVARGPR